MFAFDPEREAVFLVAGDKSGRWETWYRDAVSLADKRFDDHLQTFEVKTARKPRTQGGAMSATFSIWEQVKAKAAAVDPRTPGRAGGRPSRRGGTA